MVDWSEVVSMASHGSLRLHSKVWAGRNQVWRLGKPQAVIVKPEMKNNPGFYWSMTGAP